MGLLAAVLALGVGGEVAARVVVSQHLAAAPRLALPDGVRLAPAPGLLLPALATGALPVDATIPGAALAAVTEDLPGGRDVHVTVEGGAVVARTDLTVRGATVPVAVTLRPEVVDDDVVLRPDAVSVGGVPLPDALADRIASRRGGELLTAGVRLGDRLPDAVDVVGVHVGDAALTLRLSVPVDALG